MSVDGRQEIVKYDYGRMDVNLRDYGIGSYKQVDDAPYGGGPGMVLMPEPLDNAINSTNVNINIFLIRKITSFERRR